MLKTCASCAMSMEICMRTYAERGEVRLHLHLAVGRMPRLQLEQSMVTFQGCTPHGNELQRFPKVSAKMKRCGYMTCRNQLFYYLTMDKIGSVHSASVFKPHVSYSVNPSWISSHLEARVCCFCMFFMALGARYLLHSA